MKAILNFLQSLVLPKKIERFRNITVLIPICIMLLVASVISIPPVKVFQNNKYTYIEEQNYLLLKGLQQIPSDNAEAVKMTEEILSLKLKAEQRDETDSSSYYVDVEEMTYGDEIREWNVTYTPENDRTIHLRVLFDYYDPEATVTISSEGNSTEETVASIHQEDNLAAYKKEDTIYKADENNTYYIIIFYTDAITYGYNYYQNTTQSTSGCAANQTSEVATDNNFQSLTLDYTSEYRLDLTNVPSSPSELGKAISHFVMDGYESAYIWMIQLQIYIMVPLFTIIFSLLFWLCFKRNGKLKKFKEYFNIAGICMIVPAIVFFALEWLVPSLSDYYMYGMALYYVFVLFRINSTPELA